MSSACRVGQVVAERTGTHVSDSTRFGLFLELLHQLVVHAGLDVHYIVKRKKRSCQHEHVNCPDGEPPRTPRSRTAILARVEPDTESEPFDGLVDICRVEHQRGGLKKGKINRNNSS
jgi:hypothetical protein